MSTPAQHPGTKTIADWLAQPEGDRLEFIDGEFVQKAAPSLEHGVAQVAISRVLANAFFGRGAPDRPGGWWLATEVDIELDGRGYRPDVLGWRRDQVPTLPKGRPVTIRPDWICEILSESNRATDLVKKLRRYHQAGVPHYWILDQVDRTLTVHRHAPDGYLIALRAVAEDRVRAEPFDAIELHVAVLLGEDPEPPK